MLVSILGGYFYLVGSHFFFDTSKFTPCLFKNITGYPCPGCGMGRSTLHLMHGQWLDALYTNPLAIPFNLAVIIAIIWIVIDLVKNENKFYSLLKKDWKTEYKIALFMVLIANWLWNIIKEL